MVGISEKIRDSAKHVLSRRRAQRLLQVRQQICIEAGAGDRQGKNGWITMDVTKHCDIYWDLRRPLPFPDDRIAAIYSSHFLEHLSFREGQQFLDECLRVLIPGGWFSICVPNARIYVEAYLGVRSLDSAQLYPRAFNHTTSIDYVNYMAYMDGLHKYMFDEDNLLHILVNRGFRNVHLRRFDPSLDTKMRDYESIYAEALK